MSRFLCLIILLFFTLLTTSSIAAEQESITLQVLPVIAHIKPGDTATHQIILTNLQNERDTFSLQVKQARQQPLPTPIKKAHINPSDITIDPNKQETVTVTLPTTTAAFPTQEYTTTIEIRSLLHPEIVSTVSLTTSLFEPRDSVQLNTEIPDTLQPGEEFTITVTLHNRLDTPLENHLLSFTSELALLNTETPVNLKPQETLKKTFTFTPPPLLTPGDYGVHIGLSEHDSPKSSLKATITVREKPDVEEITDESSTFLKKTTTVTKKNIGNAPSEQRIEVYLPTFKRFFTSTTPDPTLKNEKLTWTFTLQPNTSFTLTLVTNYRSIPSGIAAIILALSLLFVSIEKSVTIKKRVLKIREDAKGATEAKIILHIRNGKRKQLPNTRIIDLIPRTAELIQDFGTLKPTKVQQGNQNTRIIWDIPALEAGEERVITYRIKTRLHATGEITLPPVSLYYMNKEQLVGVRSDPLTLTQKNLQPPPPPP